MEVGKASSSDDERRGKRYAYPFDGRQQRELSAELHFDKIREFRLEPVTLLFKELDSFVYGIELLPLSGTGRHANHERFMAKAAVSWRR